MIEKIERYIAGMEQQLEDAKKQLAMIEGALQFARQLVEDEKGEAENLPPSESEASDAGPDAA